MTTELTKRESEEVVGIAKLGSIFHQSGYFRDIKDQAQAVVKILYGRELGFSPVVSMMGIHVMDGKPSLSSNLLGTLVKRSGHYDYRVKESTDKVCSLEFFSIEKRRESLGVATFSIDDAARANLLKPGSGWTKYPRAMLFARALSAGVRLHCPDVSACPLYVPEELGATVDEEGSVTELPKSARPVEVIEQDIEIKKATQPSTPAWTEDLGGPVQEKVPAPTNGKVATSTLPLAAPLQGMECISEDQQKKLRARFRESLSDELQAKSEILLHDFLAFHKFVGSDANPHINLIPVKDFTRIGRLAVSHAKTLSGGSNDVPF